MTARLRLGVILALVAAGCSAPVREEPVSVSKGAAIGFDYPTLDGKHLSSETTRGRRTVLVFVTTYDLPSQVVVRELSEVVRTESPRINAGIVVLEPPRNLPLVEAYVTTLGLAIPVAMADAATLGGRGPFGKMESVPTIVVLDGEGRSAFRHSGGMTRVELHDVLRRMAR